MFTHFPVVDKISLLSFLFFKPSALTFRAIFRINVHFFIDMRIKFGLLAVTYSWYFSPTPHPPVKT